MEDVTIPGWAWGIMGGFVAIMVSAAVKFVADFIMLGIAKKNLPAIDTSTVQISTCAQTCRVQWELCVEKALSAAKTELGAKIDEGWVRVHSRLDQMIERQ